MFFGWQARQVMPPSEPTEPPDSEIGSTEDIADPAAALTPEPEIKDDEIDEDVEVKRTVGVGMIA